jgi:hypothetical protein
MADDDDVMTLQHGGWHKALGVAARCVVSFDEIQFARQCHKNTI